MRALANILIGLILLAGIAGLAVGVASSVSVSGSVSVEAEPPAEAPTAEFMAAIEACTKAHPEDPRDCVEAMLNQPLTTIYTEDIVCNKSGESPTAIHDEISGSARSIMIVNDSTSVVAAGGSAIDHTTTLTVCNSGCVLDTVYNPNTRKLWCESATDAGVSVEVHWGQ